MSDESVSRPAQGVGAPVEPTAGQPATRGGAAGGTSFEAQGSDALAWGIAATPLLLPLAGYVSGYLGAVPQHWTYLVPDAISLALIAADKARIKAAGGASRPLPSSWWALLPAVYLWRRATALGLAKHQAWTWICLSVANSFLFFAAVGLGVYQSSAAAPLEVPGCADPGIARTLEQIFDSLPVVKEGNTTAVSVSRQAEVVAERSSDGRRSCTAMILDHADEELPAAYQIEMRGSQVIVHMQLLDVTGSLAGRGRAG